MIPKGVPLKDEGLFKLAMTHRSATPNAIAESYERIEFYGDAVVGLVVAQYLYEHHPEWDQGVMSKARSSVVQEGPLAEAALTLGLDSHMMLGSGEESTGGRSRPSILCDVFEAVVGAIYIESGMEKARWFVLEQLHPFLKRASEGDVNPNDFKSKLQEIAQANWRKTPDYRVTREFGQDHERRFAVSVLLDNEILGEGYGRSKKDAEQNAAKDALEVIERARRNRIVREEEF